MPTLFPTAGTRVSIGGIIPSVEVDLTTSSFSAITWVVIGNTTDIGTFGDTAAPITSDEVGRPRTRKAKGTQNGGTMQLVCNLNPADAGQIAARAAEADRVSAYAFKVEYPDAPLTGSAPTGTTRLFAGRVMSITENAGGANKFVQLNLSIDIDSNVVPVAAFAGS